MTYPAEATTQGYISGIIDEQSPEVNSEDGKIMNLNFYDSRGYSYTAKLALKKVDGNNENVNSYSCELVKLLDASGKDITAQVGATMGNTEVTMNDITKSLANGYELKMGPPHTLKSPNENANGDYTEYSITDGKITATHFIMSNGTATADPDKVLSEDDAWKGVAKAFGYNSADEFKRMRSTIEDNTANPPTSKTYDISTQLATLMTDSKMVDGSGSAAGSIVFNGKNIDGCSIDFSKADGSFVGINGTAGTKVMTLKFGNDPDGASFEDITIDFSALSNQGNNKVTTASATNGSLADASIGAGRMVGKMSGLSIQNDGKIYAPYDNGQSKLLAQIAVARFANAAGLEKAGDNLYTSTQNSGDFDGIGVDITSDGGYMTPGELEMSNVDLSGELTNMIVTQRGFQANSRIITVSDTMLEELVNLKR